MTKMAQVFECSQGFELAPSCQFLSQVCWNTGEIHEAARNLFSPIFIMHLFFFFANIKGVVALEQNVCFEVFNHNSVCCINSERE